MTPVGEAEMKQTVHCDRNPIAVFHEMRKSQGWFRKNEDEAVDGR
jgi:hypothetical protein